MIWIWSRRSFIFLNTLISLDELVNYNRILLFFTFKYLFLRFICTMWTILENSQIPSLLLITVIIYLIVCLFKVNTMWIWHSKKSNRFSLPKSKQKISAAKELKRNEFLDLAHKRRSCLYGYTVPAQCKSKTQFQCWVQTLERYFG